MADWLVFCAAREVTRPRPEVPPLFALEAEEDFFALPALLVFVLLALRLPAARVLAALLREEALLLFEAIVLAAELLLVEEAGFFALLALLREVLLVAFLLPVARVFAALLREEALVLLEAKVLAAEDLLEVAAGFFAVLLLAALRLPVASVFAALLRAAALLLFEAIVLAAEAFVVLLAVLPQIKQFPFETAIIISSSILIESIHIIKGLLVQCCLNFSPHGHILIHQSNEPIAVVLFHKMA